MVTTSELMGNVTPCDPFKLEGIQTIHFFYITYSKKWCGIVEFKKDHTTGKQEFFEDGPDAFNLVVEKVRNFLSYLESVS